MWLGQREKEEETWPSHSLNQSEFWGPAIENPIILYTIDTSVGPATIENEDKSESVNQKFRNAMKREQPYIFFLHMIKMAQNMKKGLAMIVAIIILGGIIMYMGGMYNQTSDSDDSDVTSGAEGNVASDARKMASMGKAKWCKLQKAKWSWLRSPLYSSVC